MPLTFIGKKGQGSIDEWKELAFIGIKSDKWNKVEILRIGANIPNQVCHEVGNKNCIKILAPFTELKKPAVTRPM